MKTAILAGSTGLVGSHLLQKLLATDRYDKVVALSRRPLDISHPKLDNLVTNLTDLAELSSQLSGDDVFCCLGTTIRKVKTKAAFRKVDFEYPLHLAQVTHARGASQFILISALGANAQSSIFYNRVKGEVEAAIEAVGFDKYHIIRPSLLMGDRTESRSAEEAAKVFFKYLGFLVPKKYRGIAAGQVAKAMLSIAGAEQQGTHIHESAELQTY